MYPLVTFVEKNFKSFVFFLRFLKKRPILFKEPI
jgi:hypothetical protein